VMILLAVFIFSSFGCSTKIRTGLVGVAALRGAASSLGPCSHQAC
jgi:hypothetical protein